MRRKFFFPAPEAVLARLDLVALRLIREKYAPGKSDADLRATQAAIKYLDPMRQVKRNLRRISELELHGRPPLRVLDLGCGAGYFLKICGILGHDPVVGLDLDENPIYRDVVAALGVTRTIGRIEPGKAVPIEDGPFDLITAFAVCFNDHNGECPWGEAEWGFFLDDVAQRLLSPGGHLLMKLNPRDRPPGAGQFTSPEVAAAFISWGLQLDGPWVTLHRDRFALGREPRA